MRDVLAGLNPEQRRAVTYAGGPLLVLAGPGSGKTRVITSRVAHRIQSGVTPRRLLGITFTNRAAEEMKRRVSALLGEDVPVHLGTFHWMCNAMLRRHIQHLGFRRDFRLLGPPEARQVLRSLAAGDRFEGLANASWAAAISALKNGAPPDEIARRNRVAPDTLKQLSDAYAARLKTMNALDLDDLLVLSVQLLDEHPGVRDTCSSLWEEILVDEYQDTNPVQHRLLTLLAPPSGSVVVVGDEDQAIYGWRQADIHNMLRFTRDFPSAQMVKLERTYRSTKHILRAASALVAHNRDRIGKELRTERPAGDRPSCLVADDEVEEAGCIAAEVQRLAEREGYTWADFAVLYRVNAQSRAIEDALVRHGIPYQVLSGQRFYNRPEVRRVTAYLRLVVDPLDQEAEAELIGSLPGIGPKRMVALREAAGPEARLLDAATAVRSLPSPVLAAVERLRAAVSGLQAMRTAATLQVVSAAVAVAEAQLEGLPPLEQEAARENLAELRSAVREMDADRVTLRGFLDRLALGQNQDARMSGVRLMSLHAAKGLEFPVVFLPGVEEGLLPHRRSMERSQDIEEERRLCYVGMTRAQDRLYLSYVHTRLLGGQATVGHPSRFIAEVGRSNLALRVSERGREKPRLAAVQVGDRVRHRRWHAGTVLAVEGKGRETMVTIDFDRAGRQRLQLCYAPLELLPQEAIDVLAG